MEWDLDDVETGTETRSGTETASGSGTEVMTGTGMAAEIGAGTETGMETGGTGTSVKLKSEPMSCPRFCARSTLEM